MTLYANTGHYIQTHVRKYILIEFEQDAGECARVVAQSNCRTLSSRTL